VLGDIPQGLQRRYQKHQSVDEKWEAFEIFAKHLRT
jgi:hypothetical protein